MPIPLVATNRCGVQRINHIMVTTSYSNSRDPNHDKILSGPTTREHLKLMTMFLGTNYSVYCLMRCPFTKIIRSDSKTFWVYRRVSAELGRNPVSNTRFSLSMEMSRLTRDGTAESVSRDQILRRKRGQGNIHFLCSKADHEQDWQPYLVDPYSCYMP